MGKKTQLLVTTGFLSGVWLGYMYSNAWQTIRPVTLSHVSQPQYMSVTAYNISQLERFLEGYYER
ncbi:MAG: hypothetical protein ACMXYC_04480 [Candidatus Woesearchaeota archaeon]